MSDSLLNHFSLDIEKQTAAFSFKVFGHFHESVLLSDASCFHRAFIPPLFIMTGFCFVCCVSCFSDQRSNCFILHGPQQATADCFWNFFQHCRVSHFANNLHIHNPVLRCSEKVPDQP